MTREKIEHYFGESWVDFMAPFMQSPEWDAIEAELKKMKKENVKFIPGIDSMFRCFKLLSLESVRVVILGQDPYPAPGYANGLAFAHNKDVKIAPSLEKIRDAIEVDCYNGLQFDKTSFNTELTQWVEQGVLLLNTALTVPEGKAAEVAGKHADLWKPFTTYVITKLNEVRRSIIWLGWGSKAQELLKPVDPFAHFIFTAVHPAFAAREKKPWACKHFSTTNAVIVGNRLGERIKW